jgi:hypothetical protein
MIKANERQHGFANDLLSDCKAIVNRRWEVCFWMFQIHFCLGGKIPIYDSANYLVHIAMGKAPFMAPYFIFAE